MRGNLPRENREIDVVAAFVAILSVTPTLALTLQAGLCSKLECDFTVLLGQVKKSSYCSCYRILSARYWFLGLGGIFLDICGFRIDHSAQFELCRVRPGVGNYVFCESCASVLCYAAARNLRLSVLGDS